MMNLSSLTMRSVINDKPESFSPLEIKQLVKSQPINKFIENEFKPRFLKLLNDKSLDPAKSLDQQIDLISNTLNALYDTGTITKDKNIEIEVELLNQKGCLLKERKKEGDLDNAIILFKQAIELNISPEQNAVAYNNLGHAYLDRDQKGDLDAAVANFEKGAKLEHDNSFLKQILKANYEDTLSKIERARSADNSSMEDIDSEHAQELMNLFGNAKQRSSPSSKSDGLKRSRISSNSPTSASDSLFSRLVTTATTAREQLATSQEMVSLSSSSSLSPSPSSSTLLNKKIKASHSSSSSSTFQDRHSFSAPPSLSDVSSRGLRKCIKSFEESLVKWRKKGKNANEQQKARVEKSKGIEKKIHSLDQQIKETENKNEKLKSELEVLQGGIKEKQQELIKNIDDTKELQKIVASIVKSENEIVIIKEKIEGLSSEKIKKQQKEFQTKRKELIAQQKENIAELEKCVEAIKKCCQKIESYVADLNLFKSESKTRKPSKTHSGLGSSSPSSLESSSKTQSISESVKSRKRKLLSSEENSENSSSSSQLVPSFSSSSSSSSSSSLSSPSPIRIDNSQLTSSSPVVKQKKKSIHAKHVSFKSDGKSDDVVGIDKEMKEPSEKSLYVKFLPLYQKMKNSEPLTLDDIKTYFSENNVDEKSYQEGWSVLHFLVKFKQVSVLKDFLEEYTPDIKTEDGWNALQIICMDDEPDEKTEEMIKLLVKKYKAGIISLENPHGINAFDLAVYYGNKVAVKALISDVEDLSRLNKDGFNPIHYACLNESGEPDVLKILMTHGSYKSEVPASNGLTAIIMATSFQNLEMVKVILEYNKEHGRKEYLRDNEGNSAVEYINAIIKPLERGSDDHRKARRILYQLEKHGIGVKVASKK